MPSVSALAKRLVVASAIFFVSLTIAITLSLVSPFAAGASAWADEASSIPASSMPDDSESPVKATSMSSITLNALASSLDAIGDTAETAANEAAFRKEHILSYDRSLIEKIGTQESTGHGSCCPCFSCAYGDAIIYGVANSHQSYGCGMCRWPGWGGGGSSFRSLGSDQALLREAYDSIQAGKPTVVHVTSGSGQHWICLFGYKDVVDPNNLTLANFVALDPWDGAEFVASDRYRLYGDHCEHVSDAL